MQIKDPEVAKDLNNHKVQWQNSLLWIAVPVSVLSFLFQCYSLYLAKETVGAGYVISTGVALFFVSVLWTICYCKIKRFSWYAIHSWYVVNVILEIIICKSKKGDAMYAMKGIQENYFSLLLGYILIMTSVSYCEFSFCTLLHSPLFLIATYIISIEN